MLQVFFPEICAFFLHVFMHLSFPGHPFPDKWLPEASTP